MDDKQYTPAEKSAYMKEKFKPGSDAALDRGKKLAAARAIIPEHAEMLKQMFYDDAIQVGAIRTWQWLEQQHPNSHPTQPQVRKWLMEQPQHQIDRRAPKTKQIRSMAASIKRPRRLVHS